MRVRSIECFGLVALSLVLLPTDALAFAEDVCAPKGGGPLQECSPLPTACEPVGTSSSACLAAATTAFVAVKGNFGAMRSVLHADVTHLLAQAVGFSADDAYWIAAYDEVADYGAFEPFDMQGAAVGGGALKTAKLDGFVRTDVATGGMLFHFIAPRNAGSTTPPTVDGLHPNPRDASTESFLAHVRAWALAGGGSSTPSCTAGLTMPSAAGDYATGGSCFAQGGAPAPVRGGISALGPTAIPFSITTGPQVIAPGSGGAADVLSPAFDATVGGGAARIADARLGLYLHVLADRVSHHVCTDASAISGPSGPESAFRVDMTNSDCVQGLHALRHMWETGVDFTKVAAKDRTSEAGIGDVFDELAAFAKARGVANATATDATKRAALLASIAAALAKPGADVRVGAIASIACNGALAPFPGAPACASGADAGTADASVAADAADAGLDGATASPAAAAESGGCALDGARVEGAGHASLVATALGLALAWRRRRRRA